MGRAPCCDKTNVKKGPWSPEEDAKLKAYIEQYGTGGNWIALPQKIGLKRCGKSCRLRWLNYLRPNIKHGGFSEEEDNIICSLYISIGSRWSIIAAQLPGRTDNDVKNYWNTRLKKKLLGRARKQSNTNLPSQGLSSSALERLQLHMQLQNPSSSFLLNNNNNPLQPACSTFDPLILQQAAGNIINGQTYLNILQQQLQLQPDQHHQPHINSNPNTTTTALVDSPVPNNYNDQDAAVAVFQPASGNRPAAAGFSVQDDHHNPPVHDQFDCFKQVNHHNHNNIVNVGSKEEEESFSWWSNIESTTSISWDSPSIDHLQAAAEGMFQEYGALGSH